MLISNHNSALKVSAISGETIMQTSNQEEKLNLSAMLIKKKSKWKRSRSPGNSRWFM